MQVWLYPEKFWNDDSRGAIQVIQRAYNTAAALLQNVGVNHCGGNILVAEKGLNHPNVCSALQEVRSKADGGSCGR